MAKKKTKKAPTKDNQKSKLEQLKLDDGSKLIRFDEKAVTFLENLQEKLGLETVNDVIKTSIKLLAVLDDIEQTPECTLAYKNEEGKIFPISLYRTEQNEVVLNILEEQNKEQDSSVKE